MSEADDSRLDAVHDFMQDAEADAADEMGQAAAEAESKTHRDAYYDDEFDDDRSDEYEAEKLTEDLTNISIEKAQEYLGTYGDAISERIERCISEGDELLKASHFGPALTLFATSMEVALAFLVLRPLMQGAFLVDEWAELLTRRLLRGSASGHRRLLPTLVGWAGIDLEALRLTSNVKLWPDSIKAAFDRRNEFVHEGRPVEEEVARKGLESARLVIDGVITPLARHLRMTWPATPWHRGGSKTYSPAPFPIGR